jgi:hypothetical protein
MPHYNSINSNVSREVFIRTVLFLSKTSIVGSSHSYLNFKVHVQGGSNMTGTICV